MVTFSVATLRERRTQKNAISSLPQRAFAHVHSLKYGTSGYGRWYCDYLERDKYLEERIFFKFGGLFGTCILCDLEFEGTAVDAASPPRAWCCMSRLE